MNSLQSPTIDEMSIEHRPVTSSDLLPAGPLRRIGRQVFLHETIESTNQFLLERAGELVDGAVAWAEFQTAGRGRLGRRWDAPRGAAVLVSVLLHEAADSPVVTHGSLLGTVAACEGIGGATECMPVVRWPNDILLGGRKVGGVLVESSGRVTANGGQQRDTASGGGRAIVLGIGVNCLQQSGHFTGALGDTATSLERESSSPVSRARVAAKILLQIDDWLARCAGGSEGWGELRAAWRARCEDLGRRVSLEHDGRVFAGTVLDISDAGDIVVELDRGGRRCFAAATTTRFR